MKIVINGCYGGFRLSKEACDFLGFAEDSDEIFDFCRCNEETRTNPKLVECVEKLGKASWGKCSRLKVVDVPDDVEWYIDEYDGWESVHEKHRIWG